MSQQDASSTRPYRGLVVDTRALAVSKLSCTNLIFVEPRAKLNEQYYRDNHGADAQAATSDPQHCWRRVCLLVDYELVHRTWKFHCTTLWSADLLHMIKVILLLQNDDGFNDTLLLLFSTHTVLLHHPLSLSRFSCLKDFKSSSLFLLPHLTNSSLLTMLTTIILITLRITSSCGSMSFGGLQTFVMAALCNRAGHIYFHPMFSSSFFLIFLA